MFLERLTRSPEYVVKRQLVIDKKVIKNVMAIKENHGL